MSGNEDNEVRYEPDETPPLSVTVGISLQYAVLTVASIVLTPVILVSAVAGSESYLSWVVFSALTVSGVTTILQSVRLGRIGSGYPLVMGSSGAYLAVCVVALERGGGGLLAILIIAAALCQVMLAMKLSVLRKIFTPSVAGTVLMLIPITLAPVVVEPLTDIPSGASSLAGPITAVSTFSVMLVIALRASGPLRLWGPGIGLVVGSLVGGFAFDIYDVERVSEAAWVGVPVFAWPGIDFNFSADFWGLLPAFIMVTLVGALDTIGDGIAIQRISWRKPRAIDFQSIQGALSADAVGNMLSGLMGTLPNTTYAMSIVVTELTRVAARTVGICVGVMFIVLAFFPKLVALFIAVPRPAVGAFLIVLVASLFILGLRIIIQDGLDYRKGVVIGLAFWLGVAFGQNWIFPDHITGAWAALLGNGMATGGLIVVCLTQFLKLTGPRPKRLKTALTLENFPKVDEFLHSFAKSDKHDLELSRRLRAVGEELLVTLARKPEDDKVSARNLLVIARSDGPAVEMEFIASAGATNIEDQMMLLEGHPAGTHVEEEVSLRLLRHYASSVCHQKFHDTDVVTVRVGPAKSGSGLV